MHKISRLLVLTLTISMVSLPRVKGQDKVFGFLGTLYEFGKEHYQAISTAVGLGTLIYTDERTTEVIIINNSKRSFFLEDVSCSRGLFLWDVLPSVNILQGSASKFKIGSNRIFEGVSCKVEYSDPSIQQGKLSLLIENDWYGENVAESFVTPGLGIRAKINVGKGRSSQVQVVIT